VRAAGILLSIAAALVLQTTLARFVIHGRLALDLVLVLVVYVALTFGPVTGLLAGAVAGLAQDSLASGIIGIGGLAKTVVGFLAGIVGTQFIVSQWLPRLVVFFAATLLQAGVVIGLHTLLDPSWFIEPYGALMSQAAGNAILGVVAFELTARLPGALERRRAAGMRLKR
jgi:rod shape-determining protein MreD